MAIFALPTAAALSKEATKVGTDIFNSILSKNGVSPSFFSTFKFLSFLDNSTSQWRSRLAKLREFTPEGRILFYIDKMQNNQPFHGSCVQYAELFGTSYDGKSGLDDRGKVSVELLEVFNLLADEKYFRGKETATDGHTYQRARILNRLDIAPDYAAVVQKRQAASMSNLEIAKITPEGVTDSNTNMIYILVALVVIGIIAFIVSKSKKA